MARNLFLVVLIPLFAACNGERLPDPARTDAQPAQPAASAPGTPGAPETGSAAARDERGVVLFIGTSLTAGYGIGEEHAYPARLQTLIDSAGLPFRVANAGISGETSAGGLSRIDWMLQRPIDVLVIELGANDGLRGLDTAALRANIDAIIRRTRAAHPAADIVLVGMEAPPNLGESYTGAFRRVYTELAREHGTALVPFLLDGVAGEPELNLADGIHPNETGQARVARNVWPVLEPVLAGRAAATQQEDAQ